MRFRLFPTDRDGVGCYRLLYPYGLLDKNTSHEVTMTVVEWEGNHPKLELPPEIYGDGPMPAWFDADVYVLQRPLENLYPTLARWLQKRGKTVVVDMDDWFGGIPASAPAHEAVKASPHHSFDALPATLRHASLVTVSTPKLKQLYGSLAPTAVVPNYLLARDWKHVPPAYLQRRDKLRVGWYGRLVYRGRDLEILRRFLPGWLTRHPEAVFVNIGGQDALDYLGLPADRTEHIEGRAFPGHAALVAELDIGLVPLWPSVFNEAKSHLKGLELGAAGCAVVASPTGPYKQWVEPGVNGLLASTAREWSDALDTLAENDRWRQMARENYGKAWANTIDTHWNQWLDLFVPPVEILANPCKPEQGLVGSPA